MDDATRKAHLAAASAAGRDASCGTKIDYRSEASADKAATSMNHRKAAAGDPKSLEAYPCPFCGGWHVGRRMSPDELAVAAGGTT